MSYILHYTVKGQEEYAKIGDMPRAEYIVLVDGSLDDDELEEVKSDNEINNFECTKVIDLELDTDLVSLPTERALISSM